MSARTLRTLVTGATGYVGRHLVRRLGAEGWSVAALSRDPVRARSVLPAGVAVFDCGGNPTDIDTAFARFQPELVIHLATRYDGADSQHLAELVHTNIGFGVAVTEAMRRHGCRDFLNAGTYWQHYANAAYNPHSRYAASKQAFVDMLRYDCECGDIRAISLELTDIYGPGDTRRRLLNQLRDAARSGEVLAMSPGEQIIELLHIEDAVAAFLHAAALVSQPGFSGLCCQGVAGGEPLSLRQLVARINALHDQPIAINWGGRPYRARETLQPWNNPAPLPGWAPRIRLDEGLRAFFAEGASHDPA